MAEKYISVIIPCFNVEKYIDRCIESLISQTIGIDKLELIFVDDASTDGTMQKLTDWEAKYPENILVIHCDENGRQGTARNIGIQYASADYIGFVDSDDWIEPNMYESLFHNIKKYDADVATCLFKRDSGTKDLPMGKTGGENQVIYVNSAKDRKLLYHVGLRGGVWSKLYRKTLLTDNKIYFPEKLYYEDNYFSSILVQYVNSIVYIEEYLYHYFVNMESTTVTRNAKHHYEDRLQIEEMILKEYINKGWLRDFYYEMESHFIRSYYMGTLHYLFTRFDYIPAGLIPKMQKRVLDLFPEYHDNPFLLPNKLSGEKKILYDSLTQQLEPQTIRDLRERYLNYINENDVFAGALD